jgi:Family of unknown function (DUF6325)
MQVSPTTEGTMSPAETMSLGPVEMVVLGFRGNRFTGDIRPRILELVERDIVRIVDALFVTKDPEGTVRYLELEELADDVDVRDLLPEGAPQLDLFSEDDVRAFAAELEPESSALALVFEHTWMKPVRDAVEASGGFLVADVHVPGVVVQEVLASLEAVQPA